MSANLPIGNFIDRIINKSKILDEKLSYEKSSSVIYIPTKIYFKCIWNIPSVKNQFFDCDLTSTIK